MNLSKEGREELDKFIDALERVSKEAMQEYIIVQGIGTYNMWLVKAVLDLADEEGYYHLANLSEDDYLLIIEYYTQLVKVYKLEKFRKERLGR